MKAAYYEKNGEPEVFQYAELPDPKIEKDTVLIKVEFISIEGGDRLGRKLMPPPYKPFVPGYQAAGTVQSVGEDVKNYKAGDKVVAFHWNGSHAELFAVPEKFVYKVPENVEMSQASVLPVCYGTASDALFQYGKLLPGETVLIQGATGGVGIAAVQLAALCGANVIGTGSSSDSLENLKKFGLDHGINYKNEDIGKKCLELTDGRGADLVLDLAGGKSLDSLIEAITKGGRFINIGASSGEVGKLDLMQLTRKRITATGVFFGEELHSPRVHRLIESLFKLMKRGLIEMPIEHIFDLKDVQQAHKLADEGHPFGRILMKP